MWRDTVPRGEENENNQGRKKKNVCVCVWGGGHYGNIVQVDKFKIGSENFPIYDRLWLG